MASSSGDGRKRPAEADAAGQAQRVKLSDLCAPALAACGNKTWLLNTLQVSQSAGVLNTVDSGTNLRHQLQRANVNHARFITPYGRVIQSLDLGSDDCVRGWEFTKPFAWMFYMGTLNNEF